MLCKRPGIKHTDIGVTGGSPKNPIISWKAGPKLIAGLAEHLEALIRAKVKEKSEAKKSNNQKLMAKIQTIRGMNDLSPLEVKSWSHLGKVLKSIVSSYGYQEIRFPIVEKSELFTRSNEAADIVTKEMYVFQDKGGESVALRPECTAGCVRAAIDNDSRTDKGLGIRDRCSDMRDLRKAAQDNFINLVLKYLV